MGNAALRDLAVCREIPDEELAEQTVAVDAYNWLHRYLHNPFIQYTDAEDYTTTDGVEVPQVLALLRGLPGLIDVNACPVLVFDGAAHDLKAEEQQKRRDQRKSLEEQAAEARENGEYERARKLEARTHGLDAETVELVSEACERLGIPTVHAPSAGEAQAAHIAKNGDAQYVLSEDYDSLLFGAPHTVRRFTSASSPTELMPFRDTVSETGLEQYQLVDVAILCGTDYNDGIHGIGPVTAVNLVKEHGTAAEALKDSGGWIENLSELRGIFTDPEVTDSYTITHGTYDIPEFESFLTQSLGLDSGPVHGELDRLRSAVN